MNRKDIATIEKMLATLDENHLVTDMAVWVSPVRVHWTVKLSCGASVDFVVDEGEASIREADLLLKAAAILEIGQ